MPTKTYINKESGDVIKFPKSNGEKRSFSKTNGIPPILPINWVDWLSDPHVQQMNETMWGVYFAILLELWQYDQIEFDHTTLTKRLRFQDPRNVKRFLEKWAHLFVCTRCGGTVQYPCLPHAGGMLTPCRYCADPTLCACRGGAVWVLNLKLKNLKNDAIFGLPLGTTKLNINKGNEIEENVTYGADETASETGEDDELIS